MSEAGPPQPAADCRLAWRLDTGDEASVLDAAVSGAVTGLLLVVDGRFELLLVAPTGDAIALRLDPDDAPLCPEGAVDDGPRPLGAVASGGNLFLVAFGVSFAERTWVRARAFTPDGRTVPVNAPGRPGADGAPTLDFPQAAGGPSPLRMLPLVRTVVVAVRPAAPADRTPVAAVSYTGAPVADSPWPALLDARPGTGPETDWLRLRTPPAPSNTHILAPLGESLLALGPDGLQRLSSGGELEPFRFEDDRQPEPGSPVALAPDRILRAEPDSSGATVVVAYDPRGRITGRRLVPSVGRPTAATRDGRSVLLRHDDGSWSLCTTVDQAPTTGPVQVEWRGPVRAPREGGTCDR